MKGALSPSTSKAGIDDAMSEFDSNLIVATTVQSQSQACIRWHVRDYM